MKGWRTIAFNAVMLLAAVFGEQIEPGVINRHLDAFALLWAGGNAALRAITNSPIFRKG